jgi:hypothetical protein
MSSLEVCCFAANALLRSEAHSSRLPQLVRGLRQKQQLGAEDIRATI